MEKLTPQDIPQGVKSAVNAYLMARTYAECMREKVNEVYKESLGIFPLYTDRNKRRGGKSERIYDPEKMYLSKDDETCKDVYADVDFHLRKRNIKPESMPDGHCPALTAEHLQTQAQWLIIDTAGEMLGETGDFQHKLLCAGLDKYHEFIDLVVKMVVNMPDFANPLTGRKVA